MAKQKREGDWWPGQRLVRMDGIRLYGASVTMFLPQHVFVLISLPEEPFSLLCLRNLFLKVRV